MSVFSADVLIDDGGAFVSQSNEVAVFNVSPGESLLYEGRGRVKSLSGKIICDEKITEIQSLAISPDFIGDGPAALSNTTFEITDPGIRYSAKNFTKSIEDNENPVNFLLWTPAFDRLDSLYRLDMLGKIDCGGYGVYSVLASADINVVPPHVPPFSGECHNVLYKQESNTASYSCSFSQQEESSVGAEFGVLALWRKFNTTLSFDRPFDRRDRSVIDVQAPVLSCPDEEDGHCRGSSIYVGKQLSFSPPSVFLAPHIGLSSCDYGQLYPVYLYSYFFEVSVYVMMKINVSNDDSSYWVPVSSLLVQGSEQNLSFKASCSSSGKCGNGLGLGEEPFGGESWSFSGGKAMKFYQSPVKSLPIGWNFTTESVYGQSNFLALAAYFEGSSGNSWIVCPKPDPVEFNEVKTNFHGGGFVAYEDDVLDLDNVTGLSGDLS